MVNNRKMSASARRQMRAPSTSTVHTQRKTSTHSARRRSPSKDHEMTSRVAQEDPNDPMTQIDAILSRKRIIPKYDPLKEALRYNDEKSNMSNVIGLLVANEYSKGRFEASSRADYKRIKARRHWAYLRSVALTIGANQRAAQAAAARHISQREQELEQEIQQLQEKSQRDKYNLHLREFEQAARRYQNLEEELYEEPRRKFSLDEGKTESEYGYADLGVARYESFQWKKRPYLDFPEGRNKMKKGMNKIQIVHTALEGLQDADYEDVLSSEVVFTGEEAGIDVESSCSPDSSRCGTVMSHRKSSAGEENLRKISRRTKDAQITHSDVAEFQKRREEIEREKRELEELKRLQEVAHLQELLRVKKQPEYLPGFGIMPDNYKCKLRLNLIYGDPKEEFRPVQKTEQLFVQVTHIHDFTRVEMQHKKNFFVCFKLRPRDEKYKGADKYRMVNIRRDDNGRLSGKGTHCTFDISPKTLLRRELRICVKARDKLSVDFLGEVKVDFRKMNSAYEINYSNNLAYLYPKMRLAGTCSIGMLYQPQQGCLKLYINSATINSKEGTQPGDVYMKIYHLYLGQRVQRLRTAVHSETFQPQFDERFTLKLARDMIDDSCLHLKIFSKPSVPVLGDSILGEIVLANKTVSDEWQSFYKETINNQEQRKPIFRDISVMKYK